MKPTLLLLTCLIGLAFPMLGPAQPAITVQPQSQTNAVGTTALFWVVASGTEPLACQWQKLSGNWADLAGHTDTSLSLTNVQTSHAGDYRVVITNVDGSVTSDVARLTILVPPRITPTVLLQHQAVHVGTIASFRVTASGTAPLSYQWRLNGHDLSGQTSNRIVFSAVQPVDEGDYTVVVTNVAGAVTSESARLWVVPLGNALLRSDFYSAGQRLPYFYHVPTNYTSTRSYPLVCLFHGANGGENLFNQGIPGWAGYANWPPFKVFASYGQQATDPAIVVWPTTRALSPDWGPEYIQLTSALLDWLSSQYNLDTNRIYVEGLSGGVPPAWDLLGLKPGFFAGAMVESGFSGSKPATSIKDVPLWVACAADDGFVSSSRDMVTALRRAGGNPIYTEYQTGGHGDAIAQALSTPAAVNWLLAQRRGVAPTNEPVLSVASPTPQAVLLTGATNINLTGAAAALGRDVTRVTWTNFANNVKGVASGTNLWSVANIPLVTNKTNVIAVVAATTSWSPAYGGNTTFSDTLTVIQSPIRATLTLQGSQAILNWAGGGPPYRVQRAADPTAGDWTDYLTDATPPVSLPLADQAGFYRIVGQ